MYQVTASKDRWLQLLEEAEALTSLLETLHISMKFQKPSTQGTIRPLAPPCISLPKKTRPSLRMFLLKTALKNTLSLHPTMTNNIDQHSR